LEAVLQRIFSSVGKKFVNETPPASAAELEVGGEEKEILLLAPKPLFYGGVKKAIKVLFALFRLSIYLVCTRIQLI
jgi:hypothetical protein